MKVFFYRFLSLLLCLLVLLTLVPAALAEGLSAPYTLNAAFTGDEDSSFVSFPVLTGGDENICSAINSALSAGAFYPQYLGILSGVTAGSAGIRLSFESNVLPDAPISGRYLSLCVTAEGKQPQGRPGQCRYPFIFDLTTGEAIPFDALCADPDAAMDEIEAYILDEVSDEISDYMEFAFLSPVPFDRCFCDGLGNITFCYDRNDFTFLSGSAGAVTVPQSAFPDTLDLSAESILTGLLVPEKTPLAISLLGAPLDDVLSRYHATFDSCYYVEGEAYTVEEPQLRGTYLITRDGAYVDSVLFTALIPASLVRSAAQMTDPAPRSLGELDAEKELVLPGTAYTETDGSLIRTYYFDHDNTLCAVRVSKAQ